jgi:hypothetical protein
MKKIFLYISMLLSIVGNTQPSISIADFEPLAGKWKGTLTYLDYSSNKTTNIPANTSVEIISNTEFDQYVYYTEEPEKNQKTSYYIHATGTSLGDRRVIEKIIEPNGSLKLILESTGADGNDQRKAVFRHIMLISPHQFIITKMVRFDGENKFFERHTYSFSR